MQVIIKCIVTWMIYDLGYFSNELVMRKIYDLKLRDAKIQVFKWIV